MKHSPTSIILSTTMRFHGREAELARLRARFEDAAAGRTPGPHAITVVGTTGLGKSRLVQQLYVSLQRDPARNGPAGQGYWPEAFDGRDDEPADQREAPRVAYSSAPRTPSYVWLGARWYPERSRNRIDTSVLASLHRQLAQHAAAIVRATPAWWRSISALAGDLADASVPWWQRVTDAALETYGAVTELDKQLPFITDAMRQVGEALDLPVGEVRDVTLALVRELRKQPTDAMDDLAAERRQELLDESVLLARTVLRSRRPLVLWLDDMHWVDGLTAQLLERLARDSACNRLLVVATTWGREWYEQVQPKLRQLGLPAADDDALWLEPLPDDLIEQIASTSLPQLAAGQAATLARRARGNLLNLRQQIDELELIPYAFVDGDRSAALSDLGVGWVRDHQRTWREYAIEEQFGDLATDGNPANAAAHQSLIEAARTCQATQPFAAPAAADGTALATAAQPLAILRRDGIRWRFRDPAWHEAAQRAEP